MPTGIKEPRRSDLVLRSASHRIILCALLLFRVASAADVLLHSNSVIHFATVEEGQALIATKDRFISSLSPFDRQSRVETDQVVTEATYLDFLRSHVRAWNEDEIKKLTEVIETMRPKLTGLRLNLPPSVWLIKTTGREEGNAAYCRQHAVVFPQDKTMIPAAALERILTHELFHIVSSHDPQLRKDCYQVIGFQLIPPVEFPATLRDRKITNPDGSLADARIELKVNDVETLSAVPILYSTERQFDPNRGGPFFKYVKFQLLVVENQAGSWRAVERDGEPRLLVPSEVPDYRRQIGSNTGYVIHPDEILADNFVHLVHHTPGLRSPEIVSKLREVLK